MVELAYMRKSNNDQIKYFVHTFAVPLVDAQNNPADQTVTFVDESAVRCLLLILALICHLN